ncbi:hypothetical protein [Enterococcus sp. 5H]|uniref:hypothetical protein n=1 Tax=Enterococcus sp. 5H TaxID=1229490 RepID=UPI0023037D1F|nr:hypothetical protein [Enterococcus sp. 5H]MDA9470589.1 hypothetical protein [Enterococcus sp. 5H]
MAKDIFSKPDGAGTKPKTSGSGDYLGNKKQPLKNMVLNSTKEKVTATGLNIRVSTPLHGLVKAMSMVESVPDNEMYSVVGASVFHYLESLDKSTQKEVWEKMQNLIDAGVLKL